MADNDVVLYEVSERIATITMNRPEARNALYRMMQDGTVPPARELGPDLAARALELLEQSIADKETEADLARRWRDRRDPEAAKRLVGSHQRLLAEFGDATAVRRCGRGERPTARR